MVARSLFNRRINVRHFLAATRPERSGRQSVATVIHLASISAIIAAAGLADWKII